MEAITVHPKTKEQKRALETIFEAMNLRYEKGSGPNSLKDIKAETEKLYNVEFVTKMRKARKDFKEGKGTVLTPEEFKALCK